MVLQVVDVFTCPKFNQHRPQLDLLSTSLNILVVTQPVSE